MPVTSITKDPEALTITVVADFAAPVERLWEAYVDPRQLERFWGPPTYPATFTRHDAAAGGRSDYYMTSPEGERHYGYWEWTSVDERKGFEVADGFAHPDGTPNTELPTGRMVFAFEATPTGSRVTTTSHHASAEDLATVLEMGMEEGLQQAMAQMDDVLADLRTFAADIPTHTQILNDTQARISRVIKGSQEQVWRAHHDPELLQRWLLGPDGWTMPVCQVGEAVGDTYRYEWAKGEDHFGFEGEVLESAAPYRSVTTERPIGLPAEFEGSVNELTLTPVEGGTLLSLVITYTSKEIRDMVLGTGMTDGMETSYRRLEEQVLTPA